MSRIFISYSSKSKDLIPALGQDLADIETESHQVWFDHKLTGGQAWWEQILEQIRQCDLFIFALTPESLDSYPCQLEYTYAHDLGKNILPILLADGVSLNLLPPQLSTIQVVDYSRQDKQAAFRLMNALKGLPPPRALPDPLPAPPAVPISYMGSLKEQIDTPKTLSYEEQATLLVQLKDSFVTQNDSEDVRTLFIRMRQRPDLYAHIAAEIDQVLAASPRRTPRRVPQRPTAASTISRLDRLPPLVLVILGWGLAGLVVVLPTVYWLWNDLYLTNNDLTLAGAIFAFFAGCIAGYFTFHTLRRVGVPLSPEYLQWMSLGYGFAWLFGFGAQEVLSDTASTFLFQLVGLLAEWAGITLTTIFVLERNMPAIRSRRRTIAIAWAIAYFASLLAYRAVDPLFEAPLQQLAMNLTDIDSAISSLMWNTIVFNTIINALASGLLGCGLLIRAIQRVDRAYEVPQFRQA